MSPSATGYPAVASTTIESAKYNAVIADIATALTLSIAANGETTITANIPMSGYKITGLGNATADGEALNRGTALSLFALLSGPTFTGPVAISSTSPTVSMVESDGDADEKIWSMVSSGGNWYLQTYTDLSGAGANAIAITRTGTTVDSIALTATAFTVNSIDLLPSSGNFTMELATDSTGGSVLASGTAYWKRVGGVVTMRMPYLAATTTDTTLYLRGIPSACQPTLTGTYYQCPLVPGKINGADGAIQIDIYEGTAYWLLEGITAAFAGGSDTKGIGVTGSFGPVISYQVTD
mgnify:FL=1